MAIFQEIPGLENLENIFVVRHGDRTDPFEDALSTEGKLRSLKLHEQLPGIDLALSSDTARAVVTADNATATRASHVVIKPLFLSPDERKNSIIHNAVHTHGHDAPYSMYMTAWSKIALDIHTTEAAAGVIKAIRDYRASNVLIVSHYLLATALAKYLSELLWCRIPEHDEEKFFRWEDEALKPCEGYHLDFATEQSHQWHCVTKVPQPII